MPNHVYNSVQMYGDKDNLLKVKRLLGRPSLYDLEQGNKVKSGDFNFHSLVSPPTEMFKEYESGEWYGWNCDNWGTKWNAYETNCSDNIDKDDINQYFLQYSFSTAWSPPIHIIKALAEYIGNKNLDIEFSWHYEEETGWGGEYLYNKNIGLIIIKQYDEPSCHEDHIERGDDCPCSYSDERVYDDCPSDE